MQHSSEYPAPLRFQLLASTILLSGLAVRIVQFLQCRNIWLDEAFVALNVLQRTFLDLTKPLDFGQAAPMGFLWLERACVLLLGENEYALRLPSLVAGLLSVFFFWKLLRRVFCDSPFVHPFALAMFSFNEPLVAYSAQVKPYAFDALFAVLILFYSSRLIDKDGWPLTLKMTIVLILAPWFSFASLFLLIGVIVVLSPLSLRRARRHALVPLLIASSLGASSFLVHYFAFTRQRITSQLVDMWADSYLTWTPHTFSQLKHCASLLATTLYNSVGLSSVGAGLFVMLIALLDLRGVVAIATSICMASIGSAALLSANHMYPWITRLLLFAVPGILLWLTAGLQMLSTNAPPTKRFWILLFAWMSIAGVSTAEFAFRLGRSFSRQGITRVMQTIEMSGSQHEKLYVDSESQPTFLLYDRWRHYSNRFTVLPEAQDPINWIETLRGTGEVWILFPDLSIGGSIHRQSVVKALDTAGLRLQAVEYRDSAAYKYRL